MPTLAPKHTLLRSADALKFCQQQVAVSGVVRLAELPRLAASLREAEGEALVDVAFGVDQQKRKVLSGRLQAVLPLVCQRCLDSIDWPVVGQFSLALVWNDEQASQLPSTLDPVLMDSEELDLYAIVEDELLLALPLVAHHEAALCRAPSHTVTLLDIDADRKKNPFQVLSGLNVKKKPLEGS